MGSRKVLLAVDESVHSRAAVDAAFSTHCCLPTDEVHLVTVMPPIFGAVGVMGAEELVFLPAPGAREDQLLLEESKAKETLFQASELLVLDHKVPTSSIHKHVLPANGGASGVSNVVLELAKREGVDFIVVGSRGMGGVKSSIMSLVGLGSVGDALAKEARCPVLLVRQDPAKAIARGAEEQPLKNKRVCVAYDGSPASDNALTWAIKNVLQPQDELHIVGVVVPPSPFPVIDEPAAAIMYAQEAQNQEERAQASAKLTAEGAVAAAVAQGVLLSNIVNAVLTDSVVGGALTEYINKNEIPIVVCGSRGMGAWKRAFEDFIGLGSTSMHLAHTAHGIVIVLREPASEAPKA